MKKQNWNFFYQLAKDESIIKEKRKEAIERLNEISPEYLGNLSLENIQTKEATDSDRGLYESIGKKC